MTTAYGSVLSSALQGTGQADGALHKGRVRVCTEVITLASQPTSNTIPIAVPDKGWAFLFGVHNVSATLGSSTIAVGITGSTAKYKAAATFTSTDTPTLYGKTATIGVKLSAQETLFLTIAAAALPASGTYVHSTYWSAP